MICIRLCLCKRRRRLNDNIGISRRYDIKFLLVTLTKRAQNRNTFYVLNVCINVCMCFMYQPAQALCVVLDTFAQPNQIYRRS